MNFLFVSTEPSKKLKEFLVGHGCAVNSLKNIPTKERDADFIVFSPKNLDELSGIKKLRQLFPKSWLVLTARLSWYEKDSFQEHFLPFAEVDALWVRETWEATLLLMLPKLMQQYHAQVQLGEFEKQCETLKEQCDELAHKSTSLINQFEKDVSLASNIQRSLLPKFAPEIPGVVLTTKYCPAPGVGGDYYDIFAFGDKRRYGLLIADSKSHGMAAALLTVLIKIRLEELKDKFPDSKSFVQHLNQEIQHVHQKEMASLSLLYGILDRSTLTFQYTVAGTLNPFLWRLGEAPPLSTAHNPALGEANDFEFKESFITLKPSDLLMFYTDGLEPALAQEDKGATEALNTILSKSDPTPDPLNVQNEIMSNVDKHTEKSPLTDDITLIQMMIEDRALYVASESK